MRIRAAYCIVLTAACWMAASPAAAQQPAPATESVQSALCRIIDNAARDYDVPADFLTNLIWRESSFRRHVVSPAGAQGIAQFMPYTAAERGLADPFDPEQAIPQAARLIADHTARFGNLGLAAAAYNAGAGRVEKWLAGDGGLPGETRTYVQRVTGRSADAWADLSRGKAALAPPRETPSCGTMVATLRRRVPATEEPSEPVQEAPFAPWGVQLAGNFSKERALASFARERQRYAGVIGEAQPMIIGTRLRSRGTRAFYRVRVPAESRTAADQLCGRIRAVGGGCVVLRS